jgi:hypothetical protein
VRGCIRNPVDTSKSATLGKKTDKTTDTKKTNDDIKVRTNVKRTVRHRLLRPRNQKSVRTMTNATNTGVSKKEIRISKPYRSLLIR